MKEPAKRRSFYFSEDEARILEKAAKKAKMSFGEYVKRAALTCALKDIPPTAKRTYEAD